MELSACARTKKFLLDLLFPIECFGCGADGTYLCVSCAAAVPLEESFVCPSCGRPSFENAVCAPCRKTSPLDGLIAASSYGNPIVRRLVCAYKYQFIKELSVPLSALVAKALTRHPFSVMHSSRIFFIPVPLFPQRERWRGFNQAFEIASRLGQLFGIPLLDGALKRTHAAGTQAEAASRQERLRNVKGIFSVSGDELQGATVLLVDDVATTCATLSECAKALKEAGAREVWGVVVAREYAHA